MSEQGKQQWDREHKTYSAEDMQGWMQQLQDRVSELELLLGALHRDMEWHRASTFGHGGFIC